MTVKVQYKTCVKCHTIFPLEDFATKTKSPDGKSSYCTPCNRIVSKEHYNIVRKPFRNEEEWAEQYCQARKILRDALDDIPEEDSLIHDPEILCSWGILQ